MEYNNVAALFPSESLNAINFEEDVEPIIIDLFNKVIEYNVNTFNTTLELHEGPMDGAILKLKLYREKI